MPHARSVLVAIALGALGMVALSPARTPAQPGDSPFTDGRLTSAAGVKAVLEASGYAPEPVSDQEWLIKRKQGEWEVFFYVMLNADSTVLWIKCYLGRIEDAAAFGPAPYINLLKAQGVISPRFFFSVPLENGAVDLWYCRGLDNRALTTQLIADEIALAQTVMGQSAADWNFSAWTRPDAPVAEPAADPGS